MVINSKNPTLIASLLGAFMASSAVAEEAPVINPFEPQANDSRKIITISTADLAVQDACPQLLDSNIEVIDFHRLPLTQEIPTLYLSGEFDYVKNPALREDEVNKFRFALTQAQSLDRFMIHVSSLGGNTVVGDYLASDMIHSEATIITYAPDFAASNAFTVLISGSNNYRYVTTDTYMSIHQVHHYDENNQRVYESDSIGNDKKQLESANQLLIDYLQYNSITEISQGCFGVMLADYTDTDIKPLDALKFGFVDTVIDAVEGKAWRRVETKAPAPTP